MPSAEPSTEPSTDEEMRIGTHNGHLMLAALRRHHDKPVIHLGDVTLNRSTHHLSGSLGQVRLTGKECALLELFLSTPERVVPRAEHGAVADVRGTALRPRLLVVGVAPGGGDRAAAGGAGLVAGLGVAAGASGFFDVTGGFSFTGSALFMVGSGTGATS